MFGAELAGMMGTTASSLFSVLSSCCVDLDSTILASYSGSGQTWSNIVPTPADGTTQTGYDFYLGIDESGDSDPAFTGSAGTTGGYFSTTADPSLFTLKGADPSLFKNMHKKTGTPTPFWILMAWKTPASGYSGSKALFTTSDTNSQQGLGILMSPSTIIVQQRDGASGNTSSSLTASSSANTDTCVIISADFSITSNNVRCWVNNRTKIENSKTWNAASGDASQPVLLLAGANTSSFFLNSRIRTFAAGNAFIDDASAVILINAINSRHGITYV